MVFYRVSADLCCLKIYDEKMEKSQVKIEVLIFTGATIIPHTFQT